LLRNTGGSGSPCSRQDSTIFLARLERSRPFRQRYGLRPPIPEHPGWSPNSGHSFRFWTRTEWPLLTSRGALAASWEVPSKGIIAKDTRNWAALYAERREDVSCPYTDGSEGRSLPARGLSRRGAGVEFGGRDLAVESAQKIPRRTVGLAEVCIPYRRKPGCGRSCGEADAGTTWSRHRMWAGVRRRKKIGLSLGCHSACP